MLPLFRTTINRIRKAIDRKLCERTNTRRAIFLIVTTAVLFGIITIGLIPKRIDVQVGDLTQEEIRATKDMVDEVTTERYKREAMERVEPKYRVDTSIQIQIKNNIRSFFSLVKSLIEDEGLSGGEKLESLRDQEYVKLEDTEYEVLLDSSREDLSTLESSVNEVINQIMNIGAKDDDIEYAKENARSTFSRIPNIEEDLRDIGSQIVSSTIEPNKFLDLETTNKEREAAADAVEPVVIKEGEAIVSRNEIIDQNAYDLLKKSGLIRDENPINYKLMLGALIIAIAMEAIVGSYLYYFERDVFNNQKLMTVIAIVVVLVILLSRSLSIISGYIMPVATATILLSILINTRVSILMNILIGILLVITTEVETAIITVVLASGVIGSFASINTQQRSNIMVIGGIISVFNLTVVLSFGLINNLDPRILTNRSIYTVISGLLSAILAIGSMPIWENVFGILTPMKLLELMNPNQPLLKKLLTAAPGTYYHSILVGNLSENAADKVGANSLLVRVGAYYHDIGKAKRPYFFKENQVGIENPHDNISPNLSAIIITNHTKDGVKLAEESALPKPIKDIIVEHHGTTMASFFYHKALNEEGVNPNTVLESRFRYDGPKPQSKESAIVMLADSVEAAARAMKEPDEEKIKTMVRNIIKGKVEDGQLDECNLTLKNIREIEESFLRTLMGMYHERIEYPELSDIKEEK